MKTTIKWIASILLLALLLVPTMSASASGPTGKLQDGKVIFGSNYVLAKGETLDGDLVVFGGNVTIEADAVVKGSLAVIGGNAKVGKGASIDGDIAMIGGNVQMDGTVNGDMAMVGGNAELGATALVDGDINTVGGKLERADGAEITGNIVDEGPAPTITIPNQPQAPNQPSVTQPNFNFKFDPFSGIFGVFGQAIGLGVIAVLASLFLQPQMERVGSAVTSQPFVAGSFGLLSVVLAPFVLLILVVTIILSPVAFLGVMVLGLAWLFGMIAIGQEVGERFTRSFNLTWNAPITAGFGTFILVLVVGLLGLVWCVGWLFPALLAFMAIGGVALTFLNSRRSPQVVTVPSEPLPPTS